MSLVWSLGHLWVTLSVLKTVLSLGAQWVMLQVTP